jgi:hypothetical protein
MGMMMSYFQKHAADCQDRGDDCANAVTPAFEACAKAAEAEGWSPDEVAAALLSLAKERILKRMASVDTKRLISNRL